MAVVLVKRVPAKKINWKAILLTEASDRSLYTGSAARYGPIIMNNHSCYKATNDLILVTYYVVNK